MDSLTDELKKRLDANARLIAAAPLLLEACRSARDLLGRVPEIPDYEGQSVSVMLDLIVAIDQAEGRTLLGTRT